MTPLTRKRANNGANDGANHRADQGQTGRLTSRLADSSSQSQSQSSGRLSARLAAGLAGAMPTMDRRSFLKRSGIGVGAGLAATQLTMMRRADADDGKGGAGGKGDIVVRRTVCGHCSVGCAVDAVVQNGVWVRQEPVFDSPINLGAHCAKGAALREHGPVSYTHLTLPTNREV